MSKRSKIRAEYYKATGLHWKVHNTFDIPTVLYTKWLEDKIIANPQNKEDEGDCYKIGFEHGYDKGYEDFY